MIGSNVTSGLKCFSQHPGRVSYLPSTDTCYLQGSYTVKWIIAYGLELLEGQPLAMTIKIHFATKSIFTRTGDVRYGNSKSRYSPLSDFSPHFTTTHKCQTQGKHISIT